MSIFYDTSFYKDYISQIYRKSWIILHYSNVKYLYRNFLNEVLHSTHDGVGLYKYSNLYVTNKTEILLCSKTNGR